MSYPNRMKEGKSKMTAKELWDRFTKEYHINATYEAWAFCGGGEVGDRLAQLVLDGIKTATASAYISYQMEQEPIPVDGCYSVILWDNGEAACIIQTTKVTLVPFDEVSAKHAYLEGEGNRSLQYWRKVHEEAFEPDYHVAGQEFDEHGLIVLEEFKVVYRCDK